MAFLFFAITFVMRATNARIFNHSVREVIAQRFTAFASLELFSKRLCLMLNAYIPNTSFMENMPFFPEINSAAAIAPLANPLRL